MYDGSERWDQVESLLRRDGYSMSFACTYGQNQPSDILLTGHETGWEMRRKLKAWCKANGVTAYQIVRNTSYHADLHGPCVYELWTQQELSA